MFEDTRVCGGSFSRILIGSFQSVQLSYGDRVPAVGAN